MFRWLQPRQVRLVDELLTPLDNRKFLALARRHGGAWMAQAFRARQQRDEAIAQTLAALGPPAIQELLSRVGVSETSDMIIGKALREFGELGWRSLTQLADESEPPRRRALIRTLWEFEEAAAGATQWLLRTLRDADSEVRAHAAHALGRIGPGAIAASATLMTLAENEVPEVQSRAMWALTRIGTDPAIPCQIFLEALMDPDPAVMKAALHGLTTLEFDPGPYRTRLVEAACTVGLEASDAFKLLARCDGFPPNEIAALFELGCQDSGIAHFRGQLAGLLWQKTGETRWVFPLIEQLLQNGDLESACDAISELGPAALPFAARLLEQVEREPDYWDLAWASVDALGMMGPSAREYLSRIEPLKSHPSNLVQTRADIAIRRIRGETVEENP